jgi:MFS family permease
VTLTHDSTGLSAVERQGALSLAAIYAMRMMGLFLILPVFALYARHLPDHTPLLVGLAVGIYGLSQALLQIPFGLLSDRIGRKPVIIGGLILFALGSVIAATSTTIHGVILGRAVQGSGAVAAAIMALAADLTREEVRMRAMAVIGMSIGGSFMLSLVLGPMLYQWVSVPGIFWLTAGLAVGGILVMLLLVPRPLHSVVHRDAETVPALLGAVWQNPELLRLNFGVFTLHLMMTSLFLVVPLELRGLGLATSHHWVIYLPVMLASVLAMVPFVILAERYRHMKGVLMGAVLGLAVAELALFGLAQGMATLVVSLFLYFVAFNLLESTLPSLVAKMAPAAAKGTAMGLYSTSQFLGAFCGGLLGGWAHQVVGIHGVFLLGAGVALIWLLVASGMANPRYLSSQLLRVGQLNETEAALLAERLLAVPGVAEAAVVAEDGIAYLKVDKTTLDAVALQGMTISPARS